MKVLFLSIATGYGHHACARAAMDYLCGRGAECEMLDAMDYVNPILGQVVSKGFLLSSKYLDDIYSSVYRFTELKSEPSPRISISRLTHTLFSKRLESFLDEYDADVIVCTHVFAAQMVTQLLTARKSKIRAKTIGIITDFTIHPYWEDTELDYYVVASDMLANQFARKGLSSEKILPFGIPIGANFSGGMAKDEARARLGIEDKNTVLIMSGSMGFGNVIKPLKQLDSLAEFDFQIITVCGNNQKMKKSIDKLATTKKIYNYAFTEQVDLMMDAADCIVTKPGGVTTSEALAKGLVVIMNSNIPGQEERNMEFLLNNGLAMRATKTFPLDECIYHLFENPVRLEMARKLARAVAKPDAARRLGEFILDKK